MTDKIVYTKTDEAPALATGSFLPIVRAFTKTAQIDVQLKDISLAGRILAQFPDSLREDQRQEDALAELGELAKTPSANIIKLPNISASVPQLVAAITELQDHGYAVPDFPQEPKTDSEKKVAQGYAKVLGSAVNPVLREGNSDRRVARPVKEFAKSHPHSMGAWDKGSKSHVAHMRKGDFYGSERSTVIPRGGSLRISHTDSSGTSTVLRESVPVQEGEVVDAAVMSCRELKEFYHQEIDKAAQEGVLLSLHLKATMMKVSDPILFGHAVHAYFREVFANHGTILDGIGVQPKHGMGALEKAIAQLPEDQRSKIEADIKATYAKRPPLAMVDSDKGITNLHVPSDIIIDASMPAAIRSSGQMWGPDGKLHDMKAMIPDRSYAGIYQRVIEFCKKHGAFDVKTMGNVANVGLMAQKAEEYGSHDKTFEIPSAGKVQVTDQGGAVIFEHDVEAGDIWRMCQTKDAPIRDWVRLAVSRARSTGAMAIFWLDEERAHDRQLIEKVRAYLNEHDTSGLEVEVMAPVQAMEKTLERVREGQDSISVTGNVLRDYLTDLFPILELGTSAKMLSIVPLLAGGGLFETGAGGSAPKHVQQFVKEGHLRWDSLGEFLALAVSLEDFSTKSKNEKAKVLADALTEATTQLLNNDRSPSRKVHEIDNRGSHFYLALYWARALAAQTDNAELAQKFSSVAQALSDEEQTIMSQINQTQGAPSDLGGYYHPDDSKVAALMRPSAAFNRILEEM